MRFFLFLLLAGCGWQSVDDIPCSTNAECPTGARCEDLGDGFFCAAGVEGPAGADGQAGQDGSDGAAGLDGANGADGANGQDGDDGEPGADGQDGAPGADGQDGAPGADGQDGINGTDGQDGEDGLDGEDGADGPPGADGQDGINGTDGEDGEDGLDGEDGEDGEDGQDGEDLTLVANETCVLCHGEDRGEDVEAVHTGAIETIDASDDVDVIDVEIDVDGLTGAVTASINFFFDVHYEDIAGNPIYVDPSTPRSNLTQLDYVRFTLMRLVPGEDGSADTWFDYTAGERTVDNLVANLDGTWTYVIEDDLQADYEPSATHRAVIQVYHLDGIGPINKLFDFVPDGSPMRSHEVVNVESCNACHGTLIEHGGRTETGHCSACHNETHGGEHADFPTMIHGLHAAIDVDTLYGLTDDHWNFEYVTYPQDTTNCRTCHDGADPLTPEGDNWKNVPNRKACGACHTEVDFVLGTNHIGGAQPDDANCSLCHDADGIEEDHASDDPTTNNPMTPDGAWTIEYELLEARVDPANVLEIDFRISADSIALDMLALPVELTAEGRYPSFLTAWALPQGGIEAPADYNNIGNSGGDSGDIDLGDLLATGSIIDAGGGVFTATVVDGFPVGATLRAVALEGYFRQTNPAGGYWARHTRSVQSAVTNDAVRRQVVDMEKCLGCHDSIQGHGGNRVDDPQVCLFCHTPTKSSAGRVVDAAGLPQETIDAVGADPLLFPEESNNLKDMIHGIHSAEVRELGFDFVRNRSGGTYYDFSGTTFPNQFGTQDCLACHLYGTFGAELAADVLPSNAVTTDGVGATGADLAAARETVPNPTDLVSSPIAAACYSCHASSLVEGHIEQNGGIVAEEREASEL